MPPLKLEGHTLGERHRHYNRVLSTMKDKPTDIPDIDYKQSDVENLMRIDIACENRDVDYILRVFQCEDMLYISRAIKKSTWMITDEQYADIIDPNYLHSEIFPHMLTKAVNKLLLHIRLHVKDEALSEEFYHYALGRQVTEALKWLPNCSLDFIKDITSTRLSQIEPHLMKRLFKKSFELFKYLVEIHEHDEYMSHSYIKNSVHLFKSHTDEYLDIIESLPDRAKPQFSPKYTHLLMKKRPQRVFNRFSWYDTVVHFPTFAKYVKPEDAEEFILKTGHSWKSFENLKHFLVKVPKERVYDILKCLYSHNDENVDSRDRYNTLFHAIERLNWSSLAENDPSVYRWYEFAPFNAALFNLRKFIYANSSPDERHGILTVLLKCAGKDPELIKKVIQYYNERHINEPFKYNIQFANDVLSHTETHRYDAETWGVLEKIFHKMEVYIESTNQVENCVRAVIMYKLVHNQDIPKIVVDKFDFVTFKEYKNKLNEDEQLRVFKFLYEYLKKQLDVDIKNETGFRAGITALRQLWRLLKDWNKESEYQYVISKINEYAELSKVHSWKVDLNSLYSMMGPQRRHLFEQSIVMKPCDEVCINSLKHDPGLLARYKSSVETMCVNAVPLRKFLSKLRIYWPQSLALEWTEKYFTHIKNITGHKELIRGLYILLPQEDLMRFINTHVPEESKIEYSEGSEVTLSLRKHIAKNMHLARPMLPSDAILLYAKGDYLQYAVLSFKAVYYNMKSDNLRQYIEVLLDAPVSLQKHGIRLAFDKLQPSEILQKFASIWKSTKNCTTRTVLFKLTHKLLCRYQSSDLTSEAWKVLSMFIDDMNFEENKDIYSTLGNMERVPLEVISEYYKKSYLFFKSLPDKLGCSYLLRDTISFAREVMEHLDPDFVGTVVLADMYNNLAFEKHTLLCVATSFMLCCNDEDTQLYRYNKLLLPIMDQCVPMWAKNEEMGVKKGFQEFLNYLCKDIRSYVFEKNKVWPLKMCREIVKSLDTGLIMYKDYTMLTSWKLAVAYVASRAPSKENEEKSFGVTCAEYLAADIEKYFPSIYLLFGESLKHLFSVFYFSTVHELDILNSIINFSNTAPYCFLVMNLLPSPSYTKEHAKRREILRIIYQNPSLEVHMHYCKQFTETFGIWNSEHADVREIPPDTPDDVEDEENSNDNWSSNQDGEVMETEPET